jgi:serine/threonine protein kinase
MPPPARVIDAPVGADLVELVGAARACSDRCAIMSEHGEVRFVFRTGIDAEAGGVSALQAGDIVGGYRILELVGSGGMGRVYRAVQPRLERIVALKVIRPELASDEQFRAWFGREARTAASIEHPGVVPVYEASEADGILFVAMRWISGSDLRRVLATDGPLPPARAVNLLQQLADALEATHAVGMVHRDIKPANVLIEGERSYLTDFGLSRVAAGPDSLTQSNGFVGTIDYAAPEILDGGNGGVPADIYGLGCVFYETLTGQTPFPGDGVLAKIQAIAMTTPTPPSQLQPGVPSALDGVALRALAKEPSDRFGSPREFALAAQAARTSASPSRVSRQRRPRGRPLPRRVIGVGLALLAVVIAGLIVLLSPGGSHEAGAGHQSTPGTGRYVHVAGSHVYIHQRGTHLRLTDGHERISGTLPGLQTLAACHDAGFGQPGYCVASDGGLRSISTQHQTLHMLTLDLEVTHVAVSQTLRNPLGGTLNAPAHTAFVVIDATLTNRTARRQTFEPASGTVAGRQTALYLVGSHHKLEPDHGSGFADYSVEDASAAAVLKTPLEGADTYPGIAYAGALVYCYPLSQLRSRPLAILDVQEFAEGFGGSWSLGAVRLRV